MRRRFFRSTLIVMVMVLQAACTPPQAQFRNIDVTGIDYARTLNLTDHLGQPRSLADYQGKAIVVFFGFTQCPDVCPSTLANLAAVMQTLGSQADQVQVLFVTLDPERDTEGVLAQYVPAFDARFVGLRGDVQATDAVAREFKVFHEKVPGQTPTSYTLNHTAGSYVFDPEGRVRLFIRDGADAESIAHDLKLLLDGV